MAHRSTAHEVLAVVFQVREETEQVARGRANRLSTAKPRLNVLLWQRAKDPQRGAWSLPGGQVRNDEDMITSVR
ncbi:NUDIX domain-containing protein, partial [Mycobacterium sp.]